MAIESFISAMLARANTYLVNGRGNISIGGGLTLV